MLNLLAFEMLSPSQHVLHGWLYFMKYGMYISLKYYYVNGVMSMMCKQRMLLPQSTNYYSWSHGELFVMLDDVLFSWFQVY